ncbi:alpha/beta fold hydrolase [Allorhizocola rhizosphaerae]|uniref:alpha/beta fold hydrolase n=1 Tax=Allorhizocola rhizosphaerae TaxID=1872709 RepID=UPI0013C2F90E|nr:alpha/beta fold hydrolase [Allorhizocola rhizosphaerae]
MGTPLMVLVLLASMVNVPTGKAPELAWTSCPADVSSHPRQRCANVRVPLDYRDPGGRQITVMISRITAADPKRRLGTLVLSPGGPGLGGLAEPSKLYAAGQPPQLRDRYDLVGFDPRGVRHSSPVSCGLPVQDRGTRYPMPDGGIDHSIAYAQAAAAACLRHGGDLSRHITTANTARDLDRIRTALGQRRISFVGLSYGTYLGAVYASLYPHRTGRFVLDSAIDPNQVWYRFIRLGAPGLAMRLPDLATWVAARDSIYRLGATDSEVRQRYQDLTAALDNEPLVYPGLIVDGNWLRDFTRDNLEQPDDSSFELVAAVWSELAGGVATARSAPLQNALSITDNRQTVQWAVFCGDAVWPRDPETYRREVSISRRAFPDDAGRSANITPCAFWPEPAEPPVIVTSLGPRNVLILQNMRDPATPWIAGLAMRQTLGSRAALITANAGGHGVIGNNDCATALALSFLAADNTNLPQDTTCP